MKCHFGSGIYFTNFERQMIFLLDLQWEGGAFSSSWPRCNFVDQALSVNILFCEFCFIG